jgi:hypothetical protein
MAADVELFERAHWHMSASSEPGSCRYPVIGSRDHRCVSDPAVADRQPLGLSFHGLGLTQRTGPALTR